MGPPESASLMSIKAGANSPAMKFGNKNPSLFLQKTVSQFCEAIREPKLEQRKQTMYLLKENSRIILSPFILDRCLMIHILYY